MPFDWPHEMPLPHAGSGRRNRTATYDPAFPIQGLLVHKGEEGESRYPTQADFVSTAEIVAALSNKPDLRFVFLNAGFTDQVART